MIAKCILCGYRKKIKARKLCQACYLREWKRENLEAYSLVNRVSEDMALFCAEKYQEGLSINKIADLLPISQKGVYNALLRQGIEMRGAFCRIYDLWEEAFDKLGDENSLYWLGFIYADGYVRSNKNSTLRVDLQKRDVAHLKELRKFLRSTAKISSRARTKSRFISFHSKALANRLVKLGIVPYRGEFCNTKKFLPTYGIRHFIRGYLDGDGHISKSRSLVFFCGQEDILTWLNKAFVSKLKVHNRPVISTERKIKILSFYRKKDVVSILEWLYWDATIFLDRKANRAMEWIA